MKATHLGVVALLAGWLGAAPLQAATPCDALAKLSLRDAQFHKPITELRATMIGATATLPEHCQVEATIWPETKYLLKLPVMWNQRFVMTGNGGPAGVLRVPAINAILMQGYAVAGDSGGHDGSRPLFTFAYNPPDNSNPHAEQKLLDLGYRSIHESTLLSKSLLKTFYGEAAQRAYFVGNSQGGRQGMKNAQLYPRDFDGWLIGYPVLAITTQGIANVWNARAIASPDVALRNAQLPALSKAVHAVCDTADGVTDGLISSPPQCKFEAARDLPKCEANVNADSCFTAAQIAAIDKLQAGPVDSKGKRLHEGTPLGSVVAAPGQDGQPRSLWLGMLAPPDPANPHSSVSLAYGESYIRSVILKSDKWDWQTGSFDGMEARLAQLRKSIDALDPNLSRVAASGKKIIHFHGWADALVTPYGSIDYYEQVRARMGAAKTDAFYKLYLIPGMGHGPSMGPNNVGDWLGILREWVENDKAPQAVIATRAANAPAGLSEMSRPLCPYPQVARYKGMGDSNQAANFACE